MVYQTEELLKEVVSLVDESENKDCVSLVGKIEHDELEPWYNSADYFISGSHYERNRIAVCEAMSCGCIPILTDIPSFRMMTVNGGCGMLYKSGDSEELKRVLIQALHLNIEEERFKVPEQFKKELSFGANSKNQ